MKSRKINLLILFSLLLSISAVANGFETKKYTVIILDPSFQFDKDTTKQATLDSLAQQIRKKERDNKKFVCALFAFPFPFGFMGAHRVMLGTKPWVPVAYVATLGGCFGLIPLIDFCVITFSKDVEQYENNPHFFMWVK
jgi:TM2 domain-containing membrane protein YozV